MVPYSCYRLLYQPVSMITWEFLTGQLEEKEILQPSSQMFLCDMWAPPRNGQLQHYRPLLGYLLRTAVKGSPPSGKTLNRALNVYSLERMNGQMWHYILIHGL